MSILAIDFGEKHLGLALSVDKKSSQPLKVIPHQSHLKTLGLLDQICQQYQVTKLVLGIPLRNGKIRKQAERVRRFGQSLETHLELNVIFIDESLTSKQALAEMLRAEVPKRKRRQLEHAFAAKLILDEWLHSQ